MTDREKERIRDHIGMVYRTESRRVLATLIRLVGDFDLAEDALQEAVRAALIKWPEEGVPENPRAWLISTGRFKAIDALRRKTRLERSRAALEEHLEAIAAASDELEEDAIGDDRLRLIFTCCHPSLPAEAHAALTLREVCGLTTEEIARAFLISPSTLAQRIVRAKAKIREARIPYKVPSPEEFPDRLDTVLQVIYLLFNEGYSASSGDTLTRPDLSSEAIHLGRLLAELLPEAEVFGLLALMLIQESRRLARATPEGDLVLLEDQDRSLWNRPYIKEGSGLVERAMTMPRTGSYTLQAAIAAVHAAAFEPSATDWSRIVGLYDLLVELDGSPVVRLNRAVAVAMRDGPEAGLKLIDEILDRGELHNYYLAHAARADLCRRLGRAGRAREYYRQALALTRQAPERRFLERRIRELG